MESNPLGKSNTMSPDYKQLQQSLIDIGFLRGPADGVWGRFSASSLTDYQAANGLPYIDAEDLPDDYPIASPPPLNLVGGSWASAIALWHMSKGFYFSVDPKAPNICYCEGVSHDGRLVEDVPDHFNDARVMWVVRDGIPEILAAWQGTCEPGRHYTVNPMNPNGCARIEFGQYRAWELGYHNWDTNHPALIQVGPVTVARDLNQDMIRTDDKRFTGDGFGINQHHGWDNPPSYIGRASAGCLVGRSPREHIHGFMSKVRDDVRRTKGIGYIYSTTIIPGTELHRDHAW
jgi:peptidoglycan hydrolase-like protein with peptidoglycan-binding domain